MNLSSPPPTHLYARLKAENDLVAVSWVQGKCS